ncbi:hypothetical protein CDL15_Pgr019458 [Punica granatum]|uniref:Uncharacterized protein n=1 Tax=Punica granatum TaxID=22663 RepID=A0A218VTA2_PUNGR|nr:hypothetical protein CDL15_Pgr019458 [Punica granatum]
MLRSRSFSSCHQQALVLTPELSLSTHRCWHHPPCEVVNGLSGHQRPRGGRCWLAAGLAVQKRWIGLCHRGFDSVSA